MLFVVCPVDYYIKKWWGHYSRAYTFHENSQTFQKIYNRSRPITFRVTTTHTDIIVSARIIIVWPETVRVR